MPKKPSETEYYSQAQKLIKWTVNYNIVNGVPEKYIDVPESQWDEAKSDLTVQHLINQHGFVLQSCIDQPTREVWNPEMKTGTPKPKDKPKEGFLVGDKFEIASSKDRLEIINNRNGLELRYINTGKANIKTSIAAMEKVLNFGAWIRL